MKFTDSQYEAVYAANPNLLVSAAAGSGKTSVLIERIINLLKNHHLSLDRMLIVTFTRAAASEMRERLETRLYEEAETDFSLHKQIDLVAEAQISTLHSYCVNVVRDNFQYCDIDPQFTMCDEQQRAALFQECVDTAMNDLYDSAADDACAHAPCANSSAAIHYPLPTTHDACARALCAKFSEREILLMMSTLYAQLMSRPHPMDWLRAHANQAWDDETLCDSEMVKGFLSEVHLTCEGAMSLWRQGKAMSDRELFPAAYRITLAQDEETLLTLLSASEGSLRDFMSVLQNIKFKTIGRFSPVTEDEAEISKNFKALRGNYKDLVMDLRKLLPVDYDTALHDLREMIPAGIGLAQAIERFHELFQNAKRDQAVLDFHDLEHMTLSVLDDKELRAREASRFDAVFVDEYQDISAIQDAILQSLHCESKDARQLFFYVGDVKQSIYRFRLAEPWLFLAKLERFSDSVQADERRVILNQNFRSRCGVLSSVNRVFSHVMRRDVTEIEYDADAMLYAGMTSVDDPHTELHILNSGDHKPVELIMEQAEWIARDIQNTVGQPVLDSAGLIAGNLHYRDIVILMPVCKGIADKVELVLQKHGIPVYSDTAADVFRSDEIIQLVGHLSLLDNRMNDIALLSELRGPLYELSEHELTRIRLQKPEKEASFFCALQAAAEAEPESALSRKCSEILASLERELFLFQSMSSEAYLWDFLMRSGLYAHYGAQPGGRLRQANLRAFCVRVGEYVRQHGDGLTGFLTSISIRTGNETSPTIMNPWDDVVRIMSIHKSKGLEFPTVYLMGLGRAINQGAASKAFCVHPRLGFALGYVNEEARTKRTTLLQSAIMLRDAREDRAERARQLYVAMTRPKNRLVMLGTMSFENLPALPSSPGGSCEAYDVRSAKTYLDWLLQCVAPCDDVQLESDHELSTYPMWINTPFSTEFSTFSRGFPHNQAPWDVVFHMDDITIYGFDSHADNQADSGDPNSAIVSKLTRSDSLPRLMTQTDTDMGTEMEDPIAPKLSYSHDPLKIGVTALCRAEAEERAADYPSDDEQAEPILEKRVPIGTIKPKRLNVLPAAPAFLIAPAESTALERGIQTHKLLGLASLDELRDADKNRMPIRGVLERQLARKTAEGTFQPQEAKLADCSMAARFFESDLGARALAASVIKREWGFNLRIDQPVKTTLQGVIDLCFLEDEQWVVVDYKTDFIHDTDELWTRYEKQLRYYCLALARGTRYPVRECALFSLRLGKASIRTTNFDQI